MTCFYPLDYVTLLWFILLFGGGGCFLSESVSVINDTINSEFYDLVDIIPRYN